MTDFNFEIITDYGADMPDSFFKEHKIARVPMPFSVNGVEYSGENGLYGHAFYEKVRQGAVPKSSQTSLYDAEIIIENALSAEKDVLYLCFSSGISASFENIELLAAKLRLKYPAQKLIVIDTLCACGSQGLVVYYTVKKRADGLSLEETASWLEESKLKFRTLFMVDDLTLLKKGGRISTLSALAGTVLGIKPVLELNEKGRITQLNICLGRKKAIKSIIEDTKKNIFLDENEILNIGHCDCLDEAQKIGETLKAELGIQNIVYTDVNPLVGSHTGPNAMGIFFIGKPRENKSIISKIVHKNQW